VLYVTSEDTPDALLAKTLARLGCIDYTAVLQGHQRVTSEIDKALAVVWERSSAERLAYLHDLGGLSLESIQEQARAHFERFADEQGGPGILVIDYLQRLARSLRRAGGRAEELREAVTALTEQLRAVANDLGCTVLALASQNRASGYGNGKESNALASAKESGDIEYTADVILALSEDESKKGETAPGHTLCKLYLAKNRLGESNKSVALDFHKTRQNFAKGDVLY
jgi:replicative DNA helicase